MRCSEEEAGPPRLCLDLVVERSNGGRTEVRFEGVSQLEVTQRASNMPISLAIHDKRGDQWEDGVRYQAKDMEQDGPLRFLCSSFSVDGAGA